MTASEFVFVYSTFPDNDSAQRVAHALVSNRLAACVNIHGPMSLMSAGYVAPIPGTSRTGQRRGVRRNARD